LKLPSSAGWAASSCYLLEVVVTGDGVVESSHRGIICTAAGPDCQELYNPGTRVTLTRDVLSGTVVFQGWGGDCSSFGAQATITLVMQADRRCTARFTRAS
jgi:hypothetical protein